MVKYVDEFNFNQLKKLIQTKGFPKYSEVGDKAYKAIYILLMHSTTYSKANFRYVDSLLSDQISKNNFEPWMYANIIDRYYRAIDGCQVYGSFIEHNEYGKNVAGNIIDIKNLDIKRFELGIYSFYDFAKDVNIVELPKGYKKQYILNFYFDQKQNK